MAKLIFDIETVGEDYDRYDDITKEVLTRWIKKDAASDSEYQTALEDLKQGLGFSPLTGKIVAIGVMDFDKRNGAVYFDACESGTKEFEERNFKFKPMCEKDMLEKFWEVANHSQEFISFNGRGFDVPYMMIRSAIYKVRPSKDLMSNRYLSSQRYDAKHIDLMDQLTFYGAMWKRPNLHICTRAFGIESPKAQGVTGDDVAALYKEGKYEDIARYNARDLRSTCDLYEYWENYLKF